MLLLGSVNGNNAISSDGTSESPRLHPLPLPTATWSLTTLLTDVPQSVPFSPFPLTFSPCLTVPLAPAQPDHVPPSFPCNRSMISLLTPTREHVSIGPGPASGDMGAVTQPLLPTRLPHNMVDNIRGRVFAIKHTFCCADGTALRYHLQAPSPPSSPHPNQIYVIKSQNHELSAKHLQK